MTEFVSQMVHFHHWLLKGPRYAARKSHACVVCQGPLGLMCGAVPRELFPRGFYLGLIAPATVSDTCNESINPLVTRP